MTLFSAGVEDEAGRWNGVCLIALFHSFVLFFSSNRVSFAFSWPLSFLHEQLGASRCECVSGPSGKCPWNVMWGHLPDGILWSAQHIWCTVIIHSVYVIQQSKMMLQRRKCFLQNNDFGDFVFPCDSKICHKQWKLSRHFSCLVYVILCFAALKQSTKDIGLE